jgi:hypothetical protein
MLQPPRAAQRRYRCHRDSRSWDSVSVGFRQKPRNPASKAFAGMLGRQRRLRPTRSPCKCSTKSKTANFARCKRWGLRSLASILLEQSTAKMRSIPRTVRFTERVPYWGCAIAMPMRLMANTEHSPFNIRRPD